MKTWLLGLAFAAVSLAAQAHDAPAPPNARHACKADYQKFCSSVGHGHGQILECLKSHNSELSSACQQAIAQSPAKDAGAPPPAEAPKP
ncbi:MAG TPA: cysteine rich repeat-containing protein [Steroidobacteraceae bacterium]|nr:cysteine rich repeat-containing protein [Steroidobacteraceae bacterium]